MGLLALYTEGFWTAVVLTHIMSSYFLSHLCHLILTSQGCMSYLNLIAGLLHVSEQIVKMLSSDLPISKGHEHGSIGAVESLLSF